MHEICTNQTQRCLLIIFQGIVHMCLLETFLSKFVKNKGRLLIKVKHIAISKMFWWWTLISLKILYY